MNTSKLEKIITVARLDESSAGVDIAAIKIKMLLLEAAISALHETETGSLSAFFDKYLEKVRVL